MTTFNKGIYPKQNISNKEKEANDFEWYKRSIDYYVQLAINEKYGNNKDAEKARRLAKGEIDQQDYAHIIKPYKRSKLQFTKGDIKSYSLIKQILRVFIGEKRKAPFNYTVETINSDVKNKYLDTLSENLKAVAQQLIINKLNEDGQDTGVPSKPTPSIGEAVSKFNNEYRDSREIAGQELLDIIIEEKLVKETLTQAYKQDWLQLGEAYLTIDSFKDDIVIQNHNPENVWVQYNDNSLNAEDGYVFVIKLNWHIADILKRFDIELAGKYVGNGKQWSKGKRKAIDFLNELYEHVAIGTPGSMQNETFESYKKEFDNVYNDSSWTTGILAVYRVCWVGQRIYKILTYIDETGILQETEVDEEYKLNKQRGDIKVEEIVINRLHEGYLIPAGNEDYNIYLELGQPEVQRSDLNNNSSYKLPIVGRKDGLSVPLELENYQYIYDLVHKIEEHTLSKDYGQITPFPISLLPKTLGWGNDPGTVVENLMYYAYRFPFLFYDDSQTNAAQLAQSFRSVDLTTVETVIKFINLKEQVRMDAFASIGVNDGRLGQAMVSEGKGKNEQQIFRSSIHTTDMNVTFNKIEESLLNAALDYSKYAYINGKTIRRKPTKSDFIISDQTLQMYDLDVEEHLETSYNVRVKAVDIEVEKLQAMKTLIQPLAQNIGNGITPSMITKIINTDNPNKIEKYLDEAFQIQQEYQAKVQEQQGKQQNDIAARQQQMAEQQLAFDNQLKQKQIELEQTKLELDKYKAELASQTTLAVAGSNESPTNSTVETEKLRLERDKMNNDVNLRKEEIASRERIAKQKKSNK